MAERTGLGVAASSPADASSAALLRAHTAFEALHAIETHGRGVICADRGSLAIARVVARRDCLPELEDRVRAHGVELPRSPKRIEGRAIAFIGVSAEAWLATSEQPPIQLMRLLTRTLAGVAAITDQSSGYAVLRLTGPCLLDTLAKLVPLDLHPSVFAPQTAASTVVSHVGITLWRLADGTDGLPVFELAVPRSYAGSFWHALTLAAAEFGFALAKGTAPLR